ncbi:MAG: tetratricopeptide repeat protein [Alphaproteobacteria bacterium]
MTRNPAAEPDIHHASRLHQQGKIAEAAEIYRDIIAEQPRNFDANHLLGVALLQQGDATGAEMQLRVALNINPVNAAAHSNYGNVLRALKRPAEALANYDKALSIQPAYADALSNRGTALRDLGRHDEAVESFRQALALKPADVPSLQNLANLLVHLKRGPEALPYFEKLAELRPLAEALVTQGNILADLRRSDEALKCFDRAIQLKPDYFGAHLNRGNVLAQMDRMAEALESYDRVTALKPDYGDAWFNSGNILTFMKHYEQALAHYEKALVLLPNLPDTHMNVGSTLINLKRYHEALPHLEKALSLRPNHADTLVNKGAALQELKKFAEALDCFERALKLDPACTAAYINAGNIFMQLNEFSPAVASFGTALKLEPERDFIAGTRLHAKMMLCDWGDFAAATTKLALDVDAGKKTVTPFNLLSLPSTAAQQLKCAQTYAAAMFPPLPPLWKGEKYAHEKIRVAYVSADFHGHATAQLMAGLFEAHDRARFHITAISFSPDDGSPMVARLKAAFDEFIDVGALGDAEVAQLIRSRETDIAVDLKGYSQNARVNIFARRPAPVQVNFVGYPGTMGAPYIDYIIGDDVVTPPAHDKFYAEKIIRLPHSYQPNDRKRFIAPATPSRAALGLPETGFVFCGFNNHYKITPEIFAVWMRLLKQVDGSVLWLLEPNAAATSNLRASAQAAGVAPERLVFAPRVAVEDHLARHRQAGLFLDTQLYNAHTTASDALWAGLPVVTCLGGTFAGRVAASLLHAAGLPELVTATTAEYEALALKLARDPAALAALKAKLAAGRDTCALFDTAKYARDLEKAYLGMVQAL